MKYQFPLNLIIKNDYVKQDCPSITELQKPLRAAILSRRYPDKMDSSASVRSFLGTSFHAIAKKNIDETTFDDTKLLSEYNLQTYVDDFKVTGTIDLFDIEDPENAVIYDYKLTSVKSYIYQTNNDKYTEQLNGYKWMLRHAQGLNITKLIVIQIYFDWSYAESKKTKDYPDNEVVYLQLPVWSYDYADDYFNRKVRQFYMSYAMEGLPECSDTDMWKSEPKYAITKYNATKATKVCDTLEEAEQYFVDKNLPEDMYYIEQRLAEPKYCKYYCPARFICQENNLI